MTREEAIKYLIQPVATSTVPSNEFVKQMTAWSMAVRALNGEPKHGRWIRKDSKRYYWFECSECGYPPPLDKFKREWFSGYCPNCGATMDLDEVEE